jgi:hypothetical protein
MASQFPKFLASVIVPTGGWDFEWNEDGVTIPAGTYDTPLHLAAALETALDVGYTATVTISPVGKTTINITTMTSMVWGSTDDALSTALGFDETETVSSNTIVSTNQHTHGWYPGVISFGSGTSFGAGPTSDSGWQTADQLTRTYSGAGNARIIGPARRLYTRRIMFGPLKRLEIFNTRGTGAIEFRDRWSTKVLWWYPDRTDGAVGSYGTQVDPGDSNYEVDSDGQYFKVTLFRDIETQNTGNNADWFTIDIQVAAEKK